MHKGDSNIQSTVNDTNGVDKSSQCVFLHEKGYYMKSGSKSNLSYMQCIYICPLPWTLFLKYDLLILTV